ncbi:MAG: ParB/RepB/Spo0J family partition protein [Firmicutes bacterium]|nr:ParB/RepB/Spo0J family partition protein [Bacillota bacterium]
MNNKRGLGRGLSSLIPNADLAEENTLNEKLRQLPLADIVPNPNQPRQKVDEENLAELMESIKTHGLIQPIVVRPAKKTGYEIIAGERRWLAYQKLNLEHVPAIIKNYNDLEASAAALIENIQREDLNPVDEAGAYKKLMDNYDLTQEELSVRLGKSRPFIANMIRLLALPEEVKELLAGGSLTTGHARALLSLPGAEVQRKFAARIMNGKTTVRETEQMVRKYLEQPDAEELGKKAVRWEQKEWEKKLSGQLGRSIKIRKKSDGSGALLLSYKDAADLESLLNKLT